MAHHSSNKFDVKRQERRRNALARFTMKSGGDEAYVERKNQEKASLESRVKRA